ncbi:hypothetical protein DICPUDRAFT_92452 [Dictyostelium purpureum]|uniref:Smr domain-containing protein n=1 Tax=Dictyostelium purpureum TaxID=5786 RepID=F0ZS66_DICPU|nr:uncharacterized protein DICPUDRAFT_92452 [Dictyostelium purpureum]EGC33217.1 hypothetical protein DICPUDRAFT_92452 [Dictyostelium purpureum]|eukprot:XP_003290257.1 hypothetical protein DICPUDRAFT_92452 [Dictyostelium purpureum]
MGSKVNILPTKPNKVEIYSGNNEETEFKKVQNPQSKQPARRNPHQEHLLNQKSYQDHRAEAEKYAKLRNACFQAAAKAYMKNKPAEARQLSEEGKRYDEYHKEANRLASNQIFMDCNSRSGDTLRIDLHGLHVGEALDMVQRAIEIHASGEYSGNNRPQILSIITGQGNHSVNRVARIKPAVVAFLKECKIKYVDKQGVLEVDINSLRNY